MRCSMLVTVRDFALEELRSRGEFDAAADAHLRVFERLAARPDPKNRALYDQGWLERLSREHDNLIAALERALAKEPRTALRMAGQLHAYWFGRGHLRTGRYWL